LLTGIEPPISTYFTLTQDLIKLYPRCIFRHTLLLYPAGLHLPVPFGAL
jgi:hypothetical protein